MQVDLWATGLPAVLLLHIFRHLGSTAVIRCAGVCKPWRRTIIDNASCLQPRPDRFLPDLLLAFFDFNCHLGPHTTSAEKALAMESVFDVGPIDFTLASRDGFLLLKVWDKTFTKQSLCLCNLLDGSCRSLSIPAVSRSFNECSYVLATAYDHDGSSLHDDAGGAGGSAVRILAANGDQKFVTYQFFSLTSGTWSPAKRSAKLIDQDNAKVCLCKECRHAVVCGGCVVYWLVVLLSFTGDEEGECRQCLFAMDTRTEQTWTMELPEEFMKTHHQWELVLATSDDGRRLSLAAAKLRGGRQQIEVWELAGDSAWTLQRTMDLQKSPLPYLPIHEQFWLVCFCPRSGFLLATALDDSGSRQQFLVAVDGSKSRLIQTVADSARCFVLEYETDWSTYISKMKYF